MDSLLKFQIQHNLRIGEADELLRNMELHRYPKGTLLIKEGRLNDKLYILRTGVLRAFLTIDGTDQTFWFVLPGDLTFSSWGYVNNKPSRVSIIAMTEVELYEISKKELNVLYENSLSMANLGRKLIEQHSVLYDENVISYEKPTAGERYAHLISEYPEIIKVVPLHYIASYLRVTPQSLSRIRADYRRKAT